MFKEVKILTHENYIKVKKSQKWYISSSLTLFTTTFSWLIAMFYAICEHFEEYSLSPRLYY